MSENLKNKYKSNINLTDEEFAELEKAFGELVEYDVQKDGEVIGSIAFMQPDGFVIKQANKVVIEDKDVDKYAQIILRNCAVNGSEFLIQNPAVERSMAKMIDRIITPYTVSLKKRQRK